MELNDYRKKLKTLFLEKKARNQNYSMRAFARDLGLSVTVLHGVISEARHLSSKNLMKISEKLGWTRSQLQAVQFQLKNSELVDSTEKILFEDEFQLIADWKHLAILNIVKVPGMKVDKIATSLNIAVTEVESLIQRLLRLDFIQIDNSGVIQRSLKSFGTTQNIPSAAIRAFHNQNLAKAQEVIYQVPVEHRDYLTIVCATDSEKVEKVKQMIQDFRKQIQNELESKNPDRVYFCNLQLYPVTEIDGVEND